MRKTYLIVALSLVLLMGQSVESQSAGNHNYGEALQKSIYFYMQQRSGELPIDNPVIWRADSCLNDGADVGLDLTGGYLDAGDNVKFGLPMASTVATLSWSVYEYRDALADAGQLDEVLDAIKWGTDYLIKCHTAPYEFYYQVGSGGADHAWWGPVEVIEEAMDRPSYKVTFDSPGSTVVGATAAALAAASIVLGDSACLDHAKDLFDFAYSTQSDSGYTAARGFYTSYSGFWDELSAAAAWLYLATRDTDYQEKAYYLETAESCAENWGTERRKKIWTYTWTHSWDDMHYMTQILLARATGKKIYIDSIERNLDWWIPGGGVTYTPDGLAWLDSWGSLRYAANASLLAFIWADDNLGDLTKKSAYKSFAENQINYILGNNPRNGSYIIGFGNNSPQNPHHRTAHGPWYNDIDDPPTNEHTLFGALVGGPGKNDNYNDDRTDYVSNEVACDYNAALVGALAKMSSLYGGSPLSDFPQNYFKPLEQRRDEYFVRGRLLSETATSTEIIVQLTNRSAWPATVKDKLSSRYFFDLTETFNANEDITVTLGTHEGATLSGPFHWSGNVYYILIDFTGTKIYPGGRAECEKIADFTLRAPTGAAWDPTNDWSRIGLVSSPFTYEPVDLTGQTEYICVYDDGVLIWGQEPGSGEPPPPPPPTTFIHVSNIDMEVVKAKGPFYRAKATVIIVDDENTNVSGATVYGTFSGAKSNSVSGVTDTYGNVTLFSSKVKGGGSWTFCVDNVTKGGCTYNSDYNVETCDTGSNQN
jgi:hypothetical protein